jgi:hypothetical protein
MKANPLKDGALTDNSAGIGTVIREMVQERAAELATINGRSARDLRASSAHEPALRVEQMRRQL